MSDVRIIAPGDRPKPKFRPAIGPKLKHLYTAIMAALAVLGANSIYLAGTTALAYAQGVTYQTYFYFWMFLLHLALGLGLLVPFVAFLGIHMASALRLPNRTAIRYGLALMAASLVLIGSGLILIRIGDDELVKSPLARQIGYWLHVTMPLVSVGLYFAHRRSGRPIAWKPVRIWAGAMAGLVLVMGLSHSFDPRRISPESPPEGADYFEPSLVSTASGNYIPEETLMMDRYCMECHQDAYDGWFHSAHHFSSFNNKPYMASVRDTRQLSMERDGDLRAARWCAGCHDPVPFLSGKFDDPNYDDVNDPTSQAGITCTVCHSITHVESPRGNADYVVEEPQHYPFAGSDNPVLSWISNTMLKSKPEMHKQTFLKPVVRSNEFCAGCHKVHLPYELTQYKDYVAGQNHYDSYRLSGVSGMGARSFYYPAAAVGKCVDCHMSLMPSDDFGARDYDGQPGREIHDHLNLGANTGIAAIRGHEPTVKAQAEYLADNKLRVDLFGIREDGSIEGELHAPLRPEVPTLEPGQRYLVETVVRTLAVGHAFSQGTVDSNQIWVELIARDGQGRIIGRSGGLDEEGYVDPYAHFINVYMLDKDGNRIARRNAQDIFIPLYNNQIPPGAGQVVHFDLRVATGLTGPISLEARVHYRKFDRTYMDFVFGEGRGPELPIVEMARDSVVLPVAGGPSVEPQESTIAETWQRWNDYGIGLLLEGQAKGSQKGELRQAVDAFQHVVDLGKPHGWVNLARVYLREGQTSRAREALQKAADHPEPAAPWVIAWLRGQINQNNGFLDEAIADYQAVLDTKLPSRGFDFSMDDELLNALGTVTYQRGRIAAIDSPERLDYMNAAVATHRRILPRDPEDLAAHYGLGLAYADLARFFGVDRSAFQDDLARARGEGRIVEPDRLNQLAQQIADPELEAKVRRRLAHQTALAVTRFLEGPRPGSADRITPLLNLVQGLQSAWGADVSTSNTPALDDPTRAELALALEVTHKGLHRLFKPDETAAGIARKEARFNDDAADRNAQSVVIHPLHRPDAPGIEVREAIAEDEPTPEPESTRVARRSH